MRNVIYYFTGTGNSYYIAKSICNSIGKCQYIPIESAIKHEVDISKFNRVGIVFPLYCGGLPEIVLRFLDKIVFSKVKPYIFGICTRGGKSNGDCMRQLDCKLKDKGFRLKYNAYVNMPNNYIRMFKIKENLYNETKIDNSMNKVEKICNDINNLKENSYKNSFIGIISKPMYKRFIKKVGDQDRDFFADSKCISCGICERICPLGNIKLKNGKPSWNHNCQDCMACIQYCPISSIQIGEKTKNKLRYKNPYVKAEEIINNR